MSTLEVALLSLCSAGMLAVGCAADTSVDPFMPQAHDGQVAAVPARLLSGRAVVGSFYRATATVPYTGAAMRQWGADDAPLLRQVAGNALVRAERAAAIGGFYQVSHAGTWGWVRGESLTFAHAALSTTLSLQRRTAIELGRSALGFSYWWSNARWSTLGATTWPTDNRGACSGTCGSGLRCTHAPTPGSASIEYGADCSGFVSTVWGFPDQDPDTNPTNHGFSTASYVVSRAYHWSTRPIAGSLPGDAVVRYDAAAKRGHIALIVTAPTPTGTFRTYECEGCKTGCRSRTRTILDSNTTGWRAVRRVGKGWGG